MFFQVRYTFPTSNIGCTVIIYGPVEDSVARAAFDKFCPGGVVFDAKCMSGQVITAFEDYVVVVHNPSGRRYSLDRGYKVNPAHDIDFDIRNAVEVEKCHKSVHFPEWAALLPEEEFTAYWSR
jgi:hypothetical protein